MSSRLPERPDAPGELWSRFSADPRTAGDYRASDADRDLAARVIGEAYSQGRLDTAEHAERLSQALEVRRLGDMIPLLSDLAPTWRQPGAAVAPATRRRPVIRNVAIRSWLGLAALFNVIWALTVISAGELFYYWPVWPMLGTAIPLVAAWVFGGTRDDGGSPPDPQRPELR